MGQVPICQRCRRRLFFSLIHVGEEGTGDDVSVAEIQPSFDVLPPLLDDSLCFKSIGKRVALVACLRVRYEKHDRQEPSKGCRHCAQTERPTSPSMVVWHALRLATLQCTEIPAVHQVTHYIAIEEVDALLKVESLAGRAKFSNFGSEGIDVLVNLFVLLGDILRPK